MTHFATSPIEIDINFGSGNALQSTSLRIAFFGHDSSESTIIKRTGALQRSGAAVTGYMFHRTRVGPNRQPDCALVDLGRTVDRHYLRRLPKLMRAATIVARHREQLRSCDLLWARNIDMLALAVLAKRAFALDASVVYEVLDVQRVFVRPGAAGTLFRWSERQLMRSVAELVVSSPEFIRRYFAPVHNTTLRWHLLENKISAPLAVMTNGSDASRVATPPPWVIGWFGTLRCARSLRILENLARRLGPRLEVHIRGVPSHEDLREDEIRAACARNPNLHYFGGYQSPRDLQDIYRRVHFAWSIDYLDAGGNSDWLLPNRVYEGGACGAISLTRRGTATADYVEARSFGLAFAEPLEEALASFLQTASAATVMRYVHALSSAPRSAFFDLSDTADLLITLSKSHRKREQPTCVSISSS